MDEPTAPRAATWRKVVVGLGVLGVLFGVGRFALSFVHGSPNAVAAAYRVAVDRSTSSDQFAAVVDDPAGKLNLRRESIDRFDADVRALALPSSAAADRQALLDADQNYEQALDDAVGGVTGAAAQLHAAQQAHIDAVNKLAHDLGLADVIHLVQPTPF